MMTSSKRCEGVIVPMVTPCTEIGKVDAESAQRLTRYIITRGCKPFLLGTTGEATSVSGEQKSVLVKSVLEAAGQKEVVYAGISSNCMEESIDLAHSFAMEGVTYAVCHLPSYYSLTPILMKNFFWDLANSIDIPLILYNIPATTHMSIPLDIVFELSEHPNIAGIKDSERDTHRQDHLISFCNKKSGFSHIIGWGAKSAYAISNGSDGIVPSTGNLIPSLYRELYVAAKSGKKTLAEDSQAATEAISAVYQKGRSLGESLAGLKVMLSEFGLCQRYMFPPLSLLSSEEENRILSDMQDLHVSNIITKNGHLDE